MARPICTNITSIFAFMATPMPATGLFPYTTRSEFKITFERPISTLVIDAGIPIANTFLAIFFVILKWLLLISSIVLPFLRYIR